MARKFINFVPVVTVALERRTGWSAGSFTQDGALGALREALEQARAVMPRLLDDYRLDIGGTVESDAVCEHCGYRWTEKSPDYNGGCCAKDEDANPEQERAA